MKLYGLTDRGKIRSGNTETASRSSSSISSTAYRSLYRTHQGLAFTDPMSAAITVGANLSLSDLVSLLKAERPAGAYAQQVKRAILDNLAYFASNQIRNVATLAAILRQRHRSRI